MMPTQDMQVKCGTAYDKEINSVHLPDSYISALKLPK